MFGRIKQIAWGALFGCLIATQALGQATLLPNAKQQFFTPQGIPAAAGTVDMYVPSTTTRKTTWKSSTETTGNQNTNPVLLDAGGYATIYGDGAYRQVVKDADGNTIWDAVTASTGSGGGGGGTTVGDGNSVGTVLSWTGLVAPPNYVFAFGQTIIRADYPLFVTTTTITVNVICTSGLNVLSGLSDTKNIPLGAPVEASCVPPGTTVTAVASSAVTVSANASVSTAVNATFFPWGNGNGSTTINVPDLRGRTLVGRNNMGGTASTSLTSAFYNTSPNAIGAFGGAQSETLIRDNLPNISLTTTITDPQHLHALSGFGTVSVLNGSGASQGNLVTSSGGTPFSINTQNSATGITASTVTGGQNSPFSLVQPSATVNLIIKVLPDISSTVATGVASLGGMTGVIACGSNVTCGSQTISFVAPASALTVGTTVIIGGNSNGVLYNNAGILGNPATANNGVLVTSGSGVPSISNNLPPIGIGTAPAASSFLQIKTSQVNTNQTISVEAPFTLTDGVLLNISNDAQTVNKGLEIRASQVLLPTGPLNLQTANATPARGLNIGSLSWVDAYFPTLSPIYNGGNIVSASDGIQPFWALSRNSQAIIGFGIADSLIESGAWSDYGEAHRLSSTSGTIWGSEKAVVNRSTVVPIDPYNGPSGASIGHQIDSGDSYASSVFTYNTASAGIVFVKNSGVGQSGNHGFGQGIVYQVNSLDSDNTPMRAMSMTQGQGLLWYYGAAGIGTTLYSSVSGSTTAQTLLFNDTGINYVDALTSPRWAVTTTGSTNQTTRWDDNGAAVGPNLILFRASASPAASDFLANLRWDGQNSIGTQVSYGSIKSQITVATSGSERANLYFQTINGGLFILNQGLQIGAPTGGDCGIGCLNATDVRINNVSLVAGITALTGDVTATGPGTVAATLATVNTNTGSWGTATQSPQFTVNGKGLITAAANVTITPAVGSITGLGTGVATALGVNIGSAGAFVTFNGALGTPSSGVATNLTGTASGLTAGNVTTNANLTGAVTSVGNATSLGSFSSANLAAALTDETGSGLAVFGTSPAIAGGSHTGLTSLGIRDTSAAFDVTLAATSSAALTAGRTLTLNMGNVAHTLAFGTTANTITFPNLASYTVITNGDTATVTNAMLANPATTVNGQTCTLGSTCTVTSGLTVGSSTISSGTNTALLFNNAGVLGNIVALPAANFPALTGDVTTVAGALATTLATTQSAAHTWSAVNTFSNSTTGSAGGTTGALVVSVGGAYVEGNVYVKSSGGATGVILDGANQKIQLGSIDTLARNSGTGALTISTNAAGVTIAPASAVTTITGSLTISALGNVATTSAVCYNTATGVVSYDGTIGTCTISDETLKDVVGPITGALDKLLAINGFYYTWKDPSFGAGLQIGIGAQTVERVFPELVQTDSSGRKSADYPRLTAPIIEALREINLRISNLEAHK